ncbi:hypothetical protein ABW19_dt0206841 [Dactylella cylindrospora]|nr:hypothetical protein ABW19_dt0206841 [Dactylella cylindrospora]
MTDRSLIPNPSLVAILLVIRDSAGGNLVFHYPSHPRAEGAQNTTSWRMGESNTDYTSSNSSFSSSSDSDDEADDRKSRSTVRLYAGTATERSALASQRSPSYDQRSSRRQRDSDHEYDEEEDDEDESGDPAAAEWEHVLGFKHDVLAGLLSVPRALSKMRFELSVDHFVFLGYPCYNKADGTWQRRRRERKPRSEGTVKGVDTKEQETKKEADAEEEDVDGNDADDEDPDASVLARSKSPIPLPLSEKKKPKKEPRKVVEPTPSKLAMFHVVFVMNPPQLEYHTRMSDMYDVAKEFTMALKTQQAEDDYVARETEKILEMRERGEKRGESMHDLWQRILRESTLATAIATLYQGISASKIAHVKVNDFEFALQIPIMMETAVLPSISEPQLPGMHLTTLRTLGPVQSEEEDALMTRHFTLLFLEDTEDIIKEIILDQDQTSLSASFVQFIQNCKPTISFAQMLSSSTTPENQEYQYIEYFSRHLIYWRKARAIMPLHYRRYYIVSPNADMKRLASQSAAFSRLFPTLPPLPKMLSLLSGKPRPYLAYIPSKDHRQAYMDMLAWLMRYGWVTNLLTFAYLKIPKDIKLAVRARKAKEQAEAAVEMVQAASVNATAALAVNSTSPSTLSTSVEKSIANGTAIPTIDGKGTPEMNSKLSISAGGESNVSSNRPKTGYSDMTDASIAVPAAIPTKQTMGGAQPGTPFDKLESTGGDLEDSILKEPSRATPLESAWIEELTEGHTPDIVALFDRLVKYLNGKHAIEGIALRESISKRELKRVLNAMDRYIVYVRHW